MTKVIWASLATFNIGYAIGTWFEDGAIAWWNIAIGMAAALVLMLHFLVPSRRAATPTWKIGTMVASDLTAQPRSTTIADLPLRTDIVITAYRTYSITWKGNGLVLHGTCEPWRERTKAATCNGSREACLAHLSNLECSCGIYGFADRADAVDTATLGPARVVAEVVMFGYVWPHTRGYKASDVRIESLTYISPEEVVSPAARELASLLGETYGVPCEVQATGLPKPPPDVDPNLLLGAAVPAPIPTVWGGDRNVHR